MHALLCMFVALWLNASCQLPATQSPDASRLPRVLIIGDSTYTNHTRELNKLLKGRAEVVYASWLPGEIVDTKTTLRLLDRLLGRIDRNGDPIAPEKWPQWDLVHFNCGLGDLIHHAPEMQSFRVMPIHVGGIRNTSQDQYAENLEMLVVALKAKTPESQLVWASTTPIRASASNVFELGSEIQYNRIAADVMKKHGVPVNDMYTFVRKWIDMEKPAGFGADPFHFDKKPIHLPVLRLIEQTFQLTPVSELPEE